LGIEFFEINNQNAKVEGGDFITLNDVSFIGVGLRSNMEAV